MQRSIRSYENGKISDWISFRDVTFYLFLIILAYASLVYSNFSAVSCIFAFFLISKAQNSLILSGHEALHFLLFKNKKTNDFVGSFICFAPLGIPFRRSRVAHIEHHLYPLSDRDEELNRQLEKPDTREFFARLFLPLLGTYSLKGLVLLGIKWDLFPARTETKYKFDLASHRSDMRNIIIISLTLCVSLSLIDWRLYIFFWILPLVTVGAFFHNAKGFLDHVKMPTEEDGLLYSYKLKWYDKLFFPTQQALHAEHHINPNIPYHCLGNITQEIKTLPNVRFRVGYWYTLLDYYRSLSLLSASRG